MAVSGSPQFQFGAPHLALAPPPRNTQFPLGQNLPYVQLGLSGLPVEHYHNPYLSQQHGGNGVEQESLRQWSQQQQPPSYNRHFSYDRNRPPFESSSSIPSFQDHHHRGAQPRVNPCNYQEQQSHQQGQQTVLNQQPPPPAAGRPWKHQLQDAQGSSSYRYKQEQPQELGQQQQQQTLLNQPLVAAAVESLRRRQLEDDQCSSSEKSSSSRSMEPQRKHGLEDPEESARKKIKSQPPPLPSSSPSLQLLPPRPSSTLLMECSGQQNLEGKEREQRSQQQRQQTALNQPPPPPQPAVGSPQKHHLQDAQGSSSCRYQQGQPQELGQQQQQTLLNQPLVAAGAAAMGSLRKCQLKDGQRSTSEKSSSSPLLEPQRKHPLEACEDSDWKKIEPPPPPLPSSSPSMQPLPPHPLSTLLTECSGQQNLEGKERVETVKFIPILNYFQKYPPTKPYKFSVGASVGSIPIGEAVNLTTRRSSSIAYGFFQEASFVHSTQKLSWGGKFDETHLLVSENDPICVTINKEPKFPASNQNVDADLYQLLACLLKRIGEDGNRPPYFDDLIERIIRLPKEKEADREISLWIILHHPAFCDSPIRRLFLEDFYKFHISVGADVWKELRQAIGIKSYQGWHFLVVRKDEFLRKFYWKGNEKKCPPDYLSMKYTVNEENKRVYPFTSEGPILALFLRQFIVHGPEAAMLYDSLFSVTIKELELIIARYFGKFLPHFIQRIFAIQKDYKLLSEMISTYAALRYVSWRLCNAKDGKVE